MIATFADEKPIQTEVPNALLLPVLKKLAGKAKAKAKGKATKAKAAGVSFVKMYYPSGYAALRYGGGGSQLFQFGGSKYQRADLYEIWIWPLLSSSPRHWPLKRPRIFA